MLTAYFKSARTIARYRAGSAGPHLDRFVAWLADQGYRCVSIKRHVREAANFAAWTESVGLGTVPLDRAALTQLHDYLAARGRLNYPSGNCRHVAPVFVLQFLHAGHQRGVHAAELGAPFVERGVADAVLTAQLRDCRTALGLLEDGDDRTIGETGARSIQHFKESEFGKLYL